MADMIAHPQAGERAESTRNAPIFVPAADIYETEDDQNDLVPQVLRKHIRGIFFPPHRGGRRPRQVELHACALPDPAVDADVPARLFDEAVDHAQPEAAALSHLLRREERLEHPLHDLGRHAGSGIGNGEQHVLAGRHLLVLLGIILVEDSIARLQRERAGAPHRIA